MKSHIILQVNIIFYALYYNKQWHFLQKATTFLQKTANRREGEYWFEETRSIFFLKKKKIINWMKKKIKHQVWLVQIIISDTGYKRIIFFPSLVFPFFLFFFFQ